MNGSPEFREGYRADPESLDPLAADGGTVDFDFDAVDRALGEQELSEEDYTKLANGLRVILQWLVPARLNRASYQQTITRKAIALVWCLSPAHFDTSPSLKRLGKELGICDVLLSRHAVSVRRRFGIMNRSQIHGWNFDPKGGRDAG